MFFFINTEVAARSLSLNLKGILGDNGGGGHGLFCTVIVTVDQDLDFSLIDETRIAPFLSVIVHPSWVSQAPRVLSYCADALVM